jgi:3-ketosteroid 9alpha-monooxygenase subunit B
MTQYHRLRVGALIDETHDSKSIVWEVPASLASAFKYQPGQFLTLRLPIDGVFVPRCYSMSSSPALDAAPRVTVKRVHQGRGSNWICNHLKVGDEVEVMAPSGVFTPKQFKQDFLLMAGGSGITPVFSILRHALEQSTARVTLFYANRDEKSVIFRDTLNALAKAHPQRLQVIHWLDSVQGIPSVAQLAEFARPQAHAQAFICGPGPFMDAAVAALNSVKMAEADIHVERFVSLPDEAALAAAQTARQNEAPGADAVDQAQVVIAIDGQLHTIECSGQETILEAAQRVKLNLPFSCQAGMCASCMCQVVEGSVHLRHNDVLDAKDLAKSWTLACQAVPTSTHLRLKFPE